MPNTLQRNSSSSCTHGTPAGLPFGMPGSVEVMQGAMQQAAQEGRQFMEMNRNIYLGSLQPRYASSAGKIQRQIVRKNSQRENCKK